MHSGEKGISLNSGRTAMQIGTFPGGSVHVQPSQASPPCRLEEAEGYGKLMLSLARSCEAS